MQTPGARKYRDDKDEWGTTAREGYEDRGAFRPPRAPRKEPGSPFLRSLGGIAIILGICWGTYIVTQGPNGLAALQQNHGPIAIIGVGIVGSLLGKYLRV
jgi:hypothetical protein